MSVNELKPEGAEKVAAALASNTCITTLDISGNRIGDEGAEAMAVTLTKNDKLLTLLIGSNGIGDQGAERIAEAVEQRKTPLDLPNFERNRVGKQLLERIRTV